MPAPATTGAIRQAVRERIKASALAAFYATTPQDGFSRQVMRREQRKATKARQRAAAKLVIKNRRNKARTV